MKRIVHNSVSFISVATLVCLVTSRADAAPVTVAPGTPSQSVLIGTNQNMGAANPGTLLATLTSPLNIGSGHIVGSVVSAVYRNAAGLIDFYYQVVNTTAPGGTNTSISGLAGFDFGSAKTAVGYYSSAALFNGVFAAPKYFGVYESRPRSANRSADGSILSLWFGPPWGAARIDPGERSSIIMVATNARSYGFGWARVQNGGPASTDTVKSFQVPEPTSATLASIGFALLVSLSLL